MASPETVHREFLDALTAGDFDRMGDLLHPEYRYTSGDGQERSGPEAGLAVARMYKTAFPDMEPEILSTVTSGDTAVTEFRVRATNTGELAGIPPTGKPIDVRVCNVVELRDGRIYREREYFDSLAMFAQMGIVEPPGGA
jgi:steroid delta-isomerase-like uncharacterized protein